MRFYTMSDLAVVGTDPESADYSNPRGEIIREVHYIVAEEPNGHRWIVQGLGQHPDDELVALELRRLNEGSDYDPIALGWTPHYAVYGSSAYETDQQWMDIERERFDG